MADLVWLVPALPLAGAAVNLFAGRRLGRAAGWLASGLVAAAFLLSLGVLRDLLALPAGERLRVVAVLEWFRVGELRVPADLRVDPLSATMILVVTGVGALIHVYAIGYMAGDPRFGRFFAYLNLFVFFMLTLVLADDFVLLYLGWEGVGLCSYLLIGFWHERPAAARAAVKAFVTTRVGDTAMLVGLALIFLRFGTFDFGTVLAGREAYADLAARPSEATSTAIALLLFAGAVGKSAQLPLHVWLPDAMEGPTPVSALIHAATMVTAGVYLVVRAHVLFEASPVALPVVLAVGLATALYAATAALAQDDIKRVLAYSTISQLGFMFLAAGMGAYALAILLLVAHAFYKALLFLSAGSVMHGLEDETDLRRMGGLARAMPLTAAACTVGALALAGVPPLSGFFAKDHILAFASESGRSAVWALGTIGAFLSAFYVSRLLFLAFFSPPRGEGRAHESPPVMTAPLLVLAAGAAAGGLLGLSLEGGALARFLEPALGALEAGGAGPPQGVLVGASVAASLAAIGAAWWLYGSGRVDWLALRAALGSVHRFLARGWMIDDAYARLVQVPGKGAGALLARFDASVVDGAVNGVGAAFRALAAWGRRIQTGFVRNYALGFLAGAVLILVYLGLRL
ncbi:MAG TPA: NADH-quinone oxidoreductase subunit L [Actinomycetota bacterium]|nr:NADH-quinone oxidoreductase subunit L [Actinomycetota bacterium]